MTKIDDNIGNSRFKNVFMLSDQQVVEELGERFEAYRLASGLADRDIFARGGVKKDALASFKKGQNISLLNFIRILRGVGRLDALAQLFPDVETFSPVASVLREPAHKRSRIRKKSKSTKLFKWGDE